MAGWTEAPMALPGRRAAGRWRCGGGTAGALVGEGGGGKGGVGGGNRDGKGAEGGCGKAAAAPVARRSAENLQVCKAPPLGLL